MELQEGKMPGSSSPESVSTRLRQIAELARQQPAVVLTTLAHHIDVGFLEEAYRRTRKDGAVGVDGVTASDYEAELESNLQSLLDRAKSGGYRAPPVRRVHIPKADGSGRTRPIGIPAFEDKVLQRAVVMVLNEVYEQEFLDCSYGFRPGRSAHQALESLWRSLMRMDGGWVISLDIQSFFDELPHGQLRSFLDQRVRDGVLRRLIDKWLKAGVLESGALTRPRAGTPQGGVASPLLANIYLHEVLDKWFEQQVRPRLASAAELFRFADDAVLVFARESDARRVFKVLPQRFEKFGLRLHPAKTRLLRFMAPRGRTSTRDDTPGERPARSFNFLGFTHFWRRSRKQRWYVGRKTAKERVSAILKRMAQWCRRWRHLSVKLQREHLGKMLQGHYAYFGITGNYRGISWVYDRAQRIWRYWLDRRCQRRRMTWPRFKHLLKRHALPRPRVVHTRPASLSAKP